MISEAAVLAALPQHGFLRDYVHYAMRVTDAHACYHLGTGLVCLAQTAPIDLSFPYGMPMYSNVYALNVGPSGASRKSGSISVARDLLGAAVESALGETPGSREALVDGLRANPRQVIPYSEFGAFLAQAERGYLMPLKTALTEAWDSTPMGRALVRREGTEVATPRLSLMCGSTLDYLERHTEPADWTGGFMARFLTFYADRERTHTVPPGDNVEKLRLVGHLKALNEGIIVRGQCLGFDAHARQRWDDWYHSLEKVEAGTEAAGAVHRSPSQAIRVALLLAWDFGQARSGQHWHITTTELDAAIRIIEFHIDSVTRISRGLASDPNQRDRRKVLNAVSDKPKRIGQILLESKLLLRRVREIMESLLEEGTVIHDPARPGHFILPPPPEERERQEVQRASNVIQFPTPSSAGGSKTNTSSPDVSVTEAFAAAPSSGGFGDPLPASAPVGASLVWDEPAPPMVGPPGSLLTF